VFNCSEDSTEQLN